ncbi:hypothetical protein L4X63_06310 [Geomonas sp. Red32]|uniref:hypothetical protein n=1 Tax=Geomonas sp. Red32 TaxID=2912856 RepID=UPI00202CE134|nr:hypothetical protein [Geomonas sp. Red32]MCM0081196.1 hypothetical protein [Geomonas sp. Red32]
MKRHRNAVGIMEGAKNVCAIARSLVEAAEEAVGEGLGAEHDAAVRMIVHRLAGLCQVEDIAYGFDPVTGRDVFGMLMNECREKAGHEPAGMAGENERIILLRPSLKELPEGG